MKLIAIRRSVVSGVTCSAALLALLAVPAVAAAQQTRTTPPRQTPQTPRPAPAATRPAAQTSSSTLMWAGFYAGGIIGGGFAKSDATTSTVFSPTGYFAQTSVTAIATEGVQALEPKKAPFGAAAGYDVQSGNIVFGGMFDFSSLGLSQSLASTAVYPCCAPTTFTVTQSVETNWLITARGRGGYAIGNLLVFGTVGLAWTDLNYQAVFTDTFATAQENGGVDATQNALVWGFGAEYRGSPRWSVKGEWLRADFGDVTATSTNLTAFTPPIAFPANVFTHSATLKMNAIRGALSIRF
jgi:outer membrane immunogenic protein